MSTELDKQAIKLWRKEWSTDMKSAMWSGTEVCRFAAAFASQVREQSKWVSVASEMPKERGTYLVWNGRFQDVYFWAGHTKEVWGNATHWQPLPAPPQTTEQEER